MKKNTEYAATEIILNIFEAIYDFVVSHWLFCLVIVISFLSYNWGFTYAYSDLDHLAKQGIEICLVTTLALTAFIILWTGILLGKIHLLKEYLPKKNLCSWFSKNLADDFWSNTKLGGYFWSIMMSSVSSLLYTGIWWWMLLATSGHLPNSFKIFVMYLVNALLSFFIINCQICADELQNLAKEDSMNRMNANRDSTNSNDDCHDVEDEEDEFIFDDDIEGDDIFEDDEPRVHMDEHIKKFKVEFSIFLEKLRVCVVNFIEEIFAFDD